MSEQKISIGRTVLYRTPEGRVFPATVSKVWSDTCVNLHVFNGDDGKVEFVTSALLTGEDGDRFGVPGWYWPRREG